MNRDDKNKSFPTNLAEALTLLYLSKVELSNEQPETLCKKYFEVLAKIEVEIGKKNS